MSFTIGSTNTFGTSTANTGFGNTATNTGFGTSSLFGNTAAKPPAFGTQTSNLFGTTTNQPTFATSSAPTMNLFGNTTTTSLGSGFGSTLNQPSTGLQPSTFGASTTGFGTSTGFGTTGNTFNLGGTGSLFGQKPATTQPSLFSFNTSSLTQPNQSNLLNLNAAQQQQQQQQQIAQNEIDPMTFTPKLFNDEQDRILGEFNKLQAYWGFGKGYYAYNKPPVEFNQHQPLHKFKSIGFSEIKHASDDDENKFGVIVKMENEQQLNTGILQYEANLKTMFGMNFNVKVESSKQLPENKALLCISVVDTNTNKKLPAFQLISFLNQAHIKQQLNNAFVNTFIELVPLQPPSKQEIDDYLKMPPSGIDASLWEQAKKENPDPKKFIPVPFIGFAALNSRFKYQVQETEQQRLRLQIISEDIINLERDIAQMKAKLEESKRRNVSLGNRVLKTMIWAEIRRKKGFPILAEEDELRVKLESIQNELNAPTKYKGCLNELICKLRHMQSQKQILPNFEIEESLVKELQTHLVEEQQGIEHLLALIKNDLKDLKTIKGNLK